MFNRVPKLVVLYVNAYFLFLELYAFTLSKIAIFSWRAIASQIYMCPAKPDINIESWLATARPEKIAR